MEDRSRKVLFVDNFDSFTYNLVDDFCKRDCQARVYRADTSVEDLERVAAEFKPDLLVISPGPGTPDTAGVSLAAVEHFRDKLPILGVCLGHQVIAAAHGGTVDRAPEQVHGKTVMLKHDSSALFEGVRNPFEAGRYHSLVALGETLPADLEINASTDAGLVMAIRHRERPIFGVQFHPESILTEDGKILLKNFLKICGEVR